MKILFEIVGFRKNRTNNGALVSMLLLVMLFCCQPFLSLNGQQTSTAVIEGDFADPSIIRANGRYYATGTSSEWAPHFPVYTSTDLRQWKQTGYVFSKAPEWTVGSFWAPEYYYHNNTYYIYYTARRRSDNVSCIGVATSKYPDRGFQDHGVIVDFGKEAIDAFVYNDNGQLYITFKAYGLDNRPIEILASKLSPDGLQLEGEPFSLLKDNDRQGMEGQSILKRDGFYYLFYSSGNCCGNGCSYNVRVARSKSFKGPYEDYDRNPILQGDQTWKCSGHGTFVSAGDGRLAYIFHAYHKESNVFTGREGLLADLTWNKTDGWPSFTIRRSAGKHKDIITTFNEPQSAIWWQWDFRHSEPLVTQNKGQLYLSGSINPGNNTGIVLTARPVSRHFDMMTTVTNTNDALKGLAFYGDENAAIGIGVIGDKVEFWMVKDSKRTVLAETTIKAGIPVQLKLTMKQDLTCEVFYKQAGGEWKTPGNNIKQSVDFLPQWDRSPRPGLHFRGTENEQAVFADFQLVNR